MKLKKSNLKINLSYCWLKKNQNSIKFRNNSFNLLNTNNNNNNNSLSNYTTYNYTTNNSCTGSELKPRKKSIKLNLHCGKINSLHNLLYSMSSNKNSKNKISGEKNRVTRKINAINTIPKKVRVNQNASLKIMMSSTNYTNYSNNVSNSFKEETNVNTNANQWITALIANKFNSSYPSDLKTTIKSKAGVDFNFISKNYLNKGTPYDTTVRSIYLDDFYVRSWTKPSLAPAICEEYSLFNIENVQFGNYGYNKGKEHAKWAISVFKYINCFGDLNHCESQANRGGNIVCFENEKLHNIMINAVNGIDTCPS